MTDQLALPFDYGSLDTETRIVVQQRTSEIKSLVRKSIQELIEAGGKLAEVQSLLRHNKNGGFDGWLSAEKIERRFAYRCIQVHERFGNCDNLTQLDNIAPSALYLLAAPSTPDEAREEALERAERGETITHSVAKGIKESHAPMPEEVPQKFEVAVSPDSDPQPRPVEPREWRDDLRPSSFYPVNHRLNIVVRDEFMTGNALHRNYPWGKSLKTWEKDEGYVIQQKDDYAAYTLVEPDGLAAFMPNTPFVLARNKIYPSSFSKHTVWNDPFDTREAAKADPRYQDGCVMQTGYSIRSSSEYRDWTIAEPRPPIEPITLAAPAEPEENWAAKLLPDMFYAWNTDEKVVYDDPSDSKAKLRRKYGNNHAIIAITFGREIKLARSASSNPKRSWGDYTLVPALSDDAPRDGRPGYNPDGTMAGFKDGSLYPVEREFHVVFNDPHDWETAKALKDDYENHQVRFIYGRAINGHTRFIGWSIAEACLKRPQPKTDEPIPPDVLARQQVLAERQARWTAMAFPPVALEDIQPDKWYIVFATSSDILKDHQAVARPFDTQETGINYRRVNQAQLPKDASSTVILGQHYLDNKHYWMRRMDQMVPEGQPITQGNDNPQQTPAPWAASNTGADTPRSQWESLGVATAKGSGYGNGNGHKPAAEEAVLDEEPESTNGRHKPKINRAGDENEAQPFDACQTPAYALDPLLPFLKLHWTIWEPACGEGQIVHALYDAGFKEHQVIATDILDGPAFNFFEHVPHTGFECVVTNPPYSVKYRWLERCFDLDVPFALLVPVDTLGAKTAQELLKHRDFEIMLLDQRVDFKMPQKGYDGSGSQFATMWLCHHVLPQQIVFGSIEAGKRAFKQALLEAARV